VTDATEFRRGSGRLGALDVLRLQAPIAGNGFKGHVFAFVQGLVATTKDGGVVHKDILPGVLDNEAETLFVVKPLYFATCHSCSVPDLRGMRKAKNDTTIVNCAVIRFPICSCLNFYICF
jgi:hypothetical protein